VPLKQIGCVRADNLNPWKARILLLLAMTKTKDPEELQKYFDRWSICKFCALAALFLLGDTRRACGCLCPP